MGGLSTPKQFLVLGGKPIIAHTLEHFERHPLVDQIVVVCIEQWIDHLKAVVSECGYAKVRSIVQGGRTGQESIYSGLRSIESDCRFDDNTVVLVHDGVRPLINGETITRCIDSVRNLGCTATVAPAVETIIEEAGGRVQRVVDRSRCKLARAPQGFLFKDLLCSHEQAIRDGISDFTDSISLMSHYGYDIFTVEGPSENIKITTRQDYFAFKGYMDYKEMGQFWE